MFEEINVSFFVVMQEYLFQFLGQRYQVEDIVPQVTFDFLSALSQHYSQSKVIAY